MQPRKCSEQIMKHISYTDNSIIDPESLGVGYKSIPSDISCFHQNKKPEWPLSPFLGRPTCPGSRLECFEWLAWLHSLICRDRKLPRSRQSPSLSFLCLSWSHLSSSLRPKGISMTLRQEEARLKSLLIRESSNFEFYVSVEFLELPLLNLPSLSLFRSAE